MKFSTLATALLTTAATVLAVPVDNILPRGGPIYDKTTKAIIVQTYIVTETEYLYEVKCDWDKWHKTCDYKVPYSSADLTSRNSMQR
jgi:hypothetical protein